MERYSFWYSSHIKHFVISYTIIIKRQNHSQSSLSICCCYFSFCAFFKILYFPTVSKEHRQQKSILFLVFLDKILCITVPAKDISTCLPKSCSDSSTILLFSSFSSSCGRRSLRMHIMWQSVLRTPKKRIKGTAENRKCITIVRIFN